MSDAGLPQRRAILQALPALAVTAAVSPAQAAAATADPLLDADTRTWLRLVADVDKGTTLAVLRGQVWGFKPQADELTTETFARRLYGYEGLTVRHAARRPDGAIELKTKVWFFYTDSDSGEAITTLANPYTGVQAAVPTTSPPMSTVLYGEGPTAAGPPTLKFAVRRIGAAAWLEQVRLSRFKTPDIDWFKLEADMTTYVCRTADLDRPGLAFIPSTWSHNLVAEWQTWMKMHGAPGHILFRGEGGFLQNIGECPAGLKRAIDRFYPGSLSAALG